MVGRPRLEESQPAKRIVYNAIRRIYKKRPATVLSTSPDVGKTICINREINNRQEKLMDNFFKVKKQNCFALKVYNNKYENAVCVSEKSRHSSHNHGGAIGAPASSPRVFLFV